MDYCNCANMCSNVITFNSAFIFFNDFNSFFFVGNGIMDLFWWGRGFGAIAYANELMASLVLHCP